MLRKKGSLCEHRRRGTVAALVTLSMPVLLGVSALGLDAGMLFIHRRQAQTMAEAVSTAAAYQLYLSSSNTSGATAAATAMATHYGVTSPTINIPPASGTFAGKSGYVQVSLTTTSPRLFSAIWGTGTMSVTASATARAGGSQPYSPASVILLDPSSSGSLTVVGGSNIIASTPIQVNSNSPTAVNVNNGAQINAPLDIVGNKTVAAGSSITGTVATGVASVSDPLASLSAPSVPNATTTPLSTYRGYGSFTMQPGLYTGNVNLGNGGAFTMQPGTYYIQGGNFNIANGVSLTGSGVTIYIDNTNVSGTSSPGTISFQGGTTTTLTPPSSGTYSGIVYYQNRSSSVSPQFGNGATINVKGTFYAPAASLTFNGGTTTNVLSNQMIVKDINISNGATINIPYNSSTVASTAGSFALVQ
jgi:Flp pilus assembly protein TadG